MKQMLGYIWVNVGFYDDLGNLEYNLNPSKSSLIQADEFYVFSDNFDYSIVSENSQINTLLYPDDQFFTNLNLLFLSNNTVEYTFQSTDIITSLNDNSDTWILDDYFIDHELNLAQQGSIRDALELASSTTGIRFEEADSHLDAELYFYFADLATISEDNTLGVQVRLTPPELELDINSHVRNIDFDSYIIFDNQFLESNFSPGSKSFFVALHEIGHFLFLDHQDENVILDTRLDNDIHTVMTYNFGTDGTYPSDFAPLDRVVLNYLYGGDGINGEFGVYTITIRPKSRTGFYFRYHWLSKFWRAVFVE